MTTKEALIGFYKFNNLNLEADFESHCVRVYIGCILAPVPNVKARKKYLKFHDLHHIMTAYGIDRVGESEISAWELMTLAGVQFFQNTNFGGTRSQSLAKGTYTFSQLADKGVPSDWISSAKIPEGWLVTIYEGDNFTGQSWVFNSTTSNFINLSPSANDKVSSVKIE